jgi:hypothetical protein
LVAEYLDCVYRFLSPEDANTKMHALLEASLESLPDIVHTKDGSAVVRLLLAKGNAKVSVTETVCESILIARTESKFFSTSGSTLRL